MLDLMVKATYETIYMTFVATFISYVFGLPLGILMVVTEKNGIMPNRAVNLIFGAIINIFRSVPFLILMVAIFPFTELITGTTLGTEAAIVPLTVAAIPFIARLVESSIKEIDPGIIEAAQSMGAHNGQIIRKVMLAEAKPSILVGLAVAIITILGYSAMAGIVGGGGLGGLAINYGLYKYNAQVMWTAIAILVIVVQILQEAGMKIAKKTDNRI